MAGMDAHLLPASADFLRHRCVVGPEGTRALGAELAGVLSPGDAVLLHGELGAGKTCLVQGLCEALAVREDVLSPTFTLANRYQGRWTVDHLDFYRLEAKHDLQDVGVFELLDELADRRTVLLVEWPQLLVPWLPRRFELLAVCGPQPDERRWYVRGVPELPPAWLALFPESEGAC